MMVDPESLLAALANEKERKCLPNKGIARKNRPFTKRKHI
jgi:hypothetical protein